MSASGNSPLIHGAPEDPAETTPAIPAATVILLRDEPGGPSTLMLRRNPRGAFGGMWVFPGGRVEPEDHGEPGADQDNTEQDNTEGTEQAKTEAVMRRAAVREAVEECGLLLEPHELTPFSRWLPPSTTPRRFDTWFFVARAADGDVVVDGQEIHDHAWLRPAEVLELRHRGEVDLAPPTFVTLHDLSTVDSVEGAVALARQRRPVPFYQSRFADHDGDQVLLWHGDAGYELGDTRAEGPRHRLWMWSDGWIYERS